MNFENIYIYICRVFFLKLILCLKTCAGNLIGTKPKNEWRAKMTAIAVRLNRKKGVSFHGYQPGIICGLHPILMKLRTTQAVY